VIDQKERSNVLPSQAVQAGEIWVVKDGRLKKAEVKLGLRSVERVEVLSGLHADEMVVISPVGEMRETRRVRTQFMDPTEAAGLNKPKTTGESPFRGFH
jgi:multidrug efflux pump subunit AcrA (membrane-fusion protein)